jgi:hypothetical protein
MSIRFPKSCKTRAQRSEHARRVALVGWEKRRQPRQEWFVGYIEFGGPLAANKPMRVDLWAVEGQRKWSAEVEGVRLRKRLSERGVLRLVQAVLRTPRIA